MSDQAGYYPGYKIIFIRKYSDGYIDHGHFGNIRGMPSIAYQKPQAATHIVFCSDFSEAELSNESIQFDIVKTDLDMYKYIPNPTQKVTDYYNMMKVLDK